MASVQDDGEHRGRIQASLHQSYGHRDDNRNQHHIIISPAVGGRQNRNRQQERHLLRPIPGLTVLQPIKPKPDHPEGRGQELQPHLLGARVIPEHPPDSGGDAIRGIMADKIKILSENLGVEEQGDTSGQDDAGGGAGQERPTAPADGPEEKGERHEVQDVRLIRHKEHGETGQPPGLALSKPQKQHDARRA